MASMASIQRLNLHKQPGRMMKLVITYHAYPCSHFFVFCIVQPLPLFLWEDGVQETGFARVGTTILCTSPLLRVSLSVQRRAMGNRKYGIGKWGLERYCRHPGGSVERTLQKASPLDDLLTFGKQ
ncbi:hypothetical protein B0T25DRAFT_547848 [Lasiosphaeria hispida]|uniref:Uncharacterized protein n=1 Tax=Lasiosphaeria hispida TaxID=260671 RepID=A0AAJ0HEZ6_9PEZI|nr:hypothetical protein B0T25DRAFT_547848 [Lasiosphaeria hispida]